MRQCIALYAIAEGWWLLDIGRLIFFLQINRILRQFYYLHTKLDYHGITEGFHGTILADMACQQGMHTVQDTWFCPPLSDLKCSNY